MELIITSTRDVENSILGDSHNHNNAESLDVCSLATLKFSNVTTIKVSSYKVCFSFRCSAVLAYACKVRMIFTNKIFKQPHDSANIFSLFHFCSWHKKMNDPNNSNATKVAESEGEQLNLFVILMMSYVVSISNIFCVKNTLSPNSHLGLVFQSFRWFARWSGPTPGQIYPYWNYHAGTSWRAPPTIIEFIHWSSRRLGFVSHYWCHCQCVLFE